MLDYEKKQLMQLLNEDKDNLKTMHMMVSFNVIIYFIKKGVLILEK